MPDLPGTETLINPLNEEVEAGPFRKDGRAGQALIEKRVDYTLELRCTQLKYIDIRDHIKKLFDVKERQAEKYIEKADKWIAEHAPDHIEKRAEAVTKHFIERKKLKRIAWQENNYNLVYKCLKEDAKVLGVNKEEIVFTNNDEDAEELWHLPDNQRNKLEDLELTDEEQEYTNGVINE